MGKNGLKSENRYFDLLNQHLKLFCSLFISGIMAEYELKNTYMGNENLSESKTIMLLGAGFTTKNLGVWTLASSAITSILNVYRDPNIYLLDYHLKSLSHEVRHPWGSIFVPLINIRFSKKFWLPNNILRLMLTAFLLKLVPSKSICNRLLSKNPWLRKIQTSDFVCSIAGGDSFSDIYGLGRLFYVALPQILVIAIGKPLVLLPQTIGPFKSTIGKIVGRNILRRANKIYSRDYESIQVVRKLLNDKQPRLEFCYDMGFILEPCISGDRTPPWITRKDKNAPLVGLNISGLLYIGGYKQQNMFGIKGNYRKLIHEIITYFYKEHNARIVLVPHVFGIDDNKESDVSACRRIYHEIECSPHCQVYLLGGDFNHHELKALIGKCDFFLGSRMHACIGALSQCIPAVGLAYSRKFRGVFSAIGVEDLVIDLREHDNDSAIAFINKAYKFRYELRAKLEARMPCVQASILSLLSAGPPGLDQYRGKKLCLKRR